MQPGSTPDDHRKTSLVEREGWVKLRGLRPVGEDVIYLCDDASRAPADTNVISPTSLLGRLLIGCIVGDKVIFDAAGDRVTLTILEAGRAAPQGRDA